MTEQDDILARERIDGGFSFALAAFVMGLGLIAVLERVGLSEHMLRICVGVLVFSGFVTIAALLRTMRPVDFYAGGRGLPAPYAGLAYTALATGLFLPFLPPLPEGTGLKSLAAGFGAGLICALFVMGPYLRRAAAFSIADLATSRFSQPIARYAIAGIAAICASLVALGGYEIALRAFIAATGASRAFGAAVLGVLLVVLIVPSGLSGVLWLAVGATVVTLAALGLPTLLTLREAISWTAATARFHGVTGSQPDLPVEPTVVVALALGLATLAPLFGPAVASRDRVSALRSGSFGFILMGIIVVLAAVTLARSTLALDAAIVDREPGKLSAEILAASGHGQISICGVQSGASAVIAGACAAKPRFNGALRLQDIGANAGYLLGNLPVLRKEGPTLAGLAGVFAIALGIGIAAAGVQSFVTSFGHDVFHPKRRRFGPASQRLAYARALAILLIAVCGATLAAGAADPRLFITLALTISATLVAPLLALTLVKRATSVGAIAALLVGALALSASTFTHHGSLPAGELATNAIFAALDAFIGGIAVSFLHGRSSLTPRPALPAAKDEPSGPD